MTRKEFLATIGGVFAGFPFVGPAAESDDQAPNVQPEPAVDLEHDYTCIDGCTTIRAEDVNVAVSRTKRRYGQELIE